jgi:glycosyltransferase involved in cell wall biosynthesis
MRIAFYAPMKPTDDPVPSGDRRMARAFFEALEGLGHEVTLASRFRSYEGRGDLKTQIRLRDEGQSSADVWLDNHAATPPDLWFTYHLYHKAPDWLGPAISRRFGIPYVVAEASHAPKQALGPWKLGYQAAAAAIRQANAIISINPKDEPCLRALRAGTAGMHSIAPFLSVPDRPTEADRAATRKAFAAEHGLDTDVPWMLTVAMMREGAKSDSYARLADALRIMADRPWHLLIAGDGEARNRIQAHFGNDTRIRFLGRCGGLALSRLYSISDLFVWPAIREGFGMALLEAQAGGLAAVAGHTPGVASIVEHGSTGILTPPGDADAFATAVDGLLKAPARRLAYGAAARIKVEKFHSTASAQRRLNTILQNLGIHRAA